MKSKNKQFINSTTLWLFVIIILGGFFRFYKLDWGEGHFFHPDEYHIATAVSRLKFPTQMNPKLFSYGSFTVYLIYFIKKIFLLKTNAILVGRFISAFFSTLTIIITYLISKEIFKNKKVALTASLLTAITPGLIQQAHYATPESNLTFLLMTTLYLWIMYLKKAKSKYYFFSATTLGFAVGTKIVALVFLPISIIPLLLVNMSKKHKDKFPKKLMRVFCVFLAFLIITCLSYFFVFPFSILDWANFRGSMRYETGVGQGNPLVFYTRQFVDTTPVLFQFQKILPYTLGLPILISGSLGFLFTIQQLIASFGKKKNENLYALLLITFCFLAYFIPNAFLFAKWTRFIAPSFAFWSIFASYFVYKMSLLAKKKSTQNHILCALSAIVVLTTFVWTLMFFSIYANPDVRITATNWIEKNLPQNSLILTEAGNMLEVPLSGKLKKIAFDFYHLDENKKIQFELPGLLVQADYFIVQSRRMFTNHQRLPETYPITANFYDQLFSKDLGFVKIKDFNSFPKLTINHRSLTIDDEFAEETLSVFDHPVIRVYEKIKPLIKTDYEKLLKI